MDVEARVCEMCHSFQTYGTYGCVVLELFQFGNILYAVLCLTLDM